MLTEARRKQLDEIVQKMVVNKESDDTIQFVVDDFKAKYAHESEAPQEPQKPQQSLLSKVGDFIIGSEKKFGQTLGDAAASLSGDVKEAQNIPIREADMERQLVDAIIKNKQEGKDTSRLEQQLKNIKGPNFDIASIIPSVNKSAKQIAGEGLGVFMDVASAGTYGQAAKGAKTGQLLTKSQMAANVIKPLYQSAGQAFLQGAAKEAPKGALIGAGFGTAQGLQKDANTKEIIKETATGAAIGGIVSGLVGGLSARHKYLAPEKAAKLKQQAIEQYQKGLNSGKEKYKAQGEKIIPELLKEKKWGTFKGLMKQADEGIELSQKQYQELGELDGIIGTSDILEKIDKQMNTMLRPDGQVMSIKQASYKQLDALRNDIMAYQTKSWIAGEGVETFTAEQQKLRELAQNYGAELYDTRKAMKTINDSKTLSQVKYVDSAIRDLLNTKNPDYAKINKIYHLNSSLKDILIDTAQRTNSHKMVNIVRAVTSGSGATLGAYMGGLPGAVAGGITLTGIAEILNSTWYNTLKAVQKNQLAEKLLQKSAEELNPNILLLARQGSKYLTQLLNE